MTTILGIDPGSQNLGWGILEVDDQGRLVRCHQGVIQQKSAQQFNARLLGAGQAMSELCQRWRPHIAVVEKIFLGRNPDSAFKLGHIRGICLLESQRQGAKIVEYTAREVKKIITGSGSADKKSVRRWLYTQLGIVDDGKLPMDASDALALAYSYFVRGSLPSHDPTRALNM